MSSSKIIPPETPYKKSLQGEKRPLRVRCSSPREREREREKKKGIEGIFIARIVIDQSEYHDTEHATCKRSKFIFIDREEQSSKKGGKKNLIRDHARSLLPLKSVGHFCVSFGVRGIRRRAKKQGGGVAIKK